MLILIEIEYIFDFVNVFDQRNSIKWWGLLLGVEIALLSCSVSGDLTFELYDCNAINMSAVQQFINSQLIN